MGRDRIRRRWSCHNGGLPAPRSGSTKAAQRSCASAGGWSSSSSGRRLLHSDLLVGLPYADESAGRPDTASRLDAHGRAIAEASPVAKLIIPAGDGSVFSLMLESRHHPIGLIFTRSTLAVVSTPTGAPNTDEFAADPRRGRATRTTSATSAPTSSSRSRRARTSGCIATSSCSRPSTSRRSSGSSTRASRSRRRRG